MSQTVDNAIIPFFERREAQMKIDVLDISCYIESCYATA